MSNTSILGDIVVVGFGSQGRAQALNLRDSGADILVQLRPGSPHAKEASESDIRISLHPAMAAMKSQSAALMIPDGEQPQFYREYIEPNLPHNGTLIFAHGFSLHYRHIIPRADLDVILVAPLCQGDALRTQFERGDGAPCIIAVFQDATGTAQEKAIAYAEAIALTGPFIRSTVAIEVETDLFAEQAVLCGGLPELIRASFDTLCSAGYSEEIAYICCLRELGAMTDLMLKTGIAGSRRRISDTALFGAISRGPRIINDSTRRELASILAEIRSGQFNGELNSERKDGYPKIKEAMAREESHPIEEVHRRFMADGTNPKG